LEVGFERMAELQEEIGSLCAAAHLPVIWATQVLETLAKKGMPSRAEVSDVVLAARTQCVMLNKGPHLPAAIRFLADVLKRMEGHQDKHFRLMRALRVAAVEPEGGAWPDSAR
jgi:pyruvate kinase